ncbi:MAG: hypothetical protein GX265_04270 [Mollicutes bacterium]|jgi:hypothetical protein|nr:hypothetical protein [Mollicutes bacterium]
MYYNQVQDDRIFFAPFLAPFLLGGIGGAAIASVARPRPVYVTPPPVYYPQVPTYGYNYYGGYNYNPYYR